uniref:Uncharacterized protein n=1 Tax=Arundo donax TaxID=35708 RepID=A0A0A9DH43_ARUDO
MGRRQKMWNPLSHPSHSISSAAASPDLHASHLTSSSLPPSASTLGGVRARVRRRSWLAAPIRSVRVRARGQRGRGKLR